MTNLTGPIQAHSVVRRTTCSPPAPFVIVLPGRLRPYCQPGPGEGCRGVPPDRTARRHAGGRHPPEQPERLVVEPQRRVDLGGLEAALRERAEPAHFRVLGLSALLDSAAGASSAWTMPGVPAMSISVMRDGLVVFFLVRGVRPPPVVAVPAACVGPTLTTSKVSPGGPTRNAVRVAVRHEDSCRARLGSIAAIRVLVRRASLTRSVRSPPRRSSPDTRPAPQGSSPRPLTSRASAGACRQRSARSRNFAAAPSRWRGGAEL